MKFIMLDIGAGTMDILYYDSDRSVHYKAVVRSPALTAAERLAEAEGDLLITGVEMGGGSLASLLKEKAQKARVLISKSAGATINHNAEKVESLGLRVIDDEEAQDLKSTGKYTCFDLSDLEYDRIKSIVESMGVPFCFDVIAICAQDHGVPEPGMSHLDYRHNIFKERLDKRPFPHEMLYSSENIPLTFNRLKSIARRAGQFPASEVYVMDSGMAAVLGGTLDPVACEKDRKIILDIATSHTVGASFEGDELCGSFEYHTVDITKEILESLLVNLADGNLDHSEILARGGHGAYIRKSFGFDNLELILSTGPKRSLACGSRLDIVSGAPFGDNMMTGAAGLLEAVRIRKGLEKFTV